MAEELKDLIEKIQEEGVKTAEDKAKSIREEAKAEAAGILEETKRKAENLVSEATSRIARMEESGKVSLRHAGRDLMLALRKEINNMLDKIVVSHVQKALNPAELARIITLIIKESKGKEKKDIVVSLKKQDLETVEQNLMKELKTETMKGIMLRAQEDIRGGFIISYDKGKSYYDFTDKTLAEHIALYLKPKLAEMLKEEAPAGKKTGKK